MGRRHHSPSRGTDSTFRLPIVPTESQIVPAQQAPRRPMATASGLDDRETYLQWRKRLDDFSESDEAPKQLSEQSRRIIAVAIVDYTLLGRALRQTIEGQRAWRRFREQLAPVMLDHLYGGYGNVREAIEMLMTFSAQVAEQQSAFVESRVGGLLLSSPDVRESEDGPNSST